MKERRNQTIRRWVYVGIAVILLLLIAAPLVFTRERAFESALSREIQRGQGTVIRFPELAHFRWDRVYIFGPYTPASRIEQTLGFSWRGAAESGIEMSETFYLIVFVSERQVTLSVRFPRFGDFDPSVCGRVLTPTQAAFVVTRDPNGLFTLSQVQAHGAG